MLGRGTLGPGLEPQGVNELSVPLVQGALSAWGSVRGV
jgi:hypothetical protein